MFLLQLVVILLVALLFLHIRYQLRVTNSLEIYEIDFKSNSALQTVCENRLPVVFDAPVEFHKFDVNKLSKTQLAHDSNTFLSGKTGSDPTKVTLQSALILAQRVTAETKDDLIFSERNSQLLDDADLLDYFVDNDEFLKPNFTISKCFDLVFGAHGATTPLQYHINCRRFFYISQGRLTVKFAPWKFEKYMHTSVDYKNLRFESDINPWDVQDEHKDDAERINFVDVEIPAGKIMYIPPYVWYSIRFEDEVRVMISEDSTEKQGETLSVPAIVQNFTYLTPMNIAAISPVLLRHQVERLLM